MNTPPAGNMDSLTLIIITTIITASVTAIVGAFFNPLGQNLFEVIRYSRPGLRMRKIGKKWKTTWSFNDQDKSQSHGDIIKLRQIGPFIYGNAEGEKHSYSIKGRLYPDGYFMGTWHDTQEHTDWYGSFQLKLETEGKKMAGKWIGKSGTGIRSGEWIWEQC